MDAAMYVFANRGLNMTPGKLAAQVAHAAVEAVHIDWGSFLHDEWYVAKHYKKLIMAAEDEQHLWNIKHYLEERDFKTVMIIDEGMTEVRPHSATALGVALVDKDDPEVAAAFSSFKSYKPVKQKQPNGRVAEWLNALAWKASKG